MIEPNDILSRKNEIKGYVAIAKLDLAVKRCIDFFRDFDIDEDDEALLLSTSLYLIYNEEKIGQITSQDAIVRKQQVAARILKLTKDFTNFQARTW